jgi:transposase
MHAPLLSDRHWELLCPVISPAQDNSSHPKLHGRPPMDDRQVLEGILHVITHHISWINLPAGYPSHMTCFRRYTAWVKSGVWEDILTVLFEDFHQRTGIDLFHEWRSWFERDRYGHISSVNIPLELNESMEDRLVVVLFMQNLIAMLHDDRRRVVPA